MKHVTGPYMELTDTAVSIGSIAFRFDDQLVTANLLLVNDQPIIILPPTVKKPWYLRLLAWFMGPNPCPYEFE